MNLNYTREKICLANKSELMQEVVGEEDKVNKLT